MESRQRPAKDTRQPSRRARSKTHNASPKRSFIPVDPGFSFQTHRALIGLALLTLLLNSLIFAPISWWPLAFICLVPWLLFVGAADRAPRVYLYSYLFGLAFFLINMHWLYVSTGPGYVVLSIYLAAYFPLMACPVRHVVRRRRWPLALVFPFVWTGSELLRAVVISGFPWFFLSHSLHGVLSLIQISDLIGAYGVSFVVATVNGAIADWIIAWAGFRRSNKDDLCPTHRASVWRPLVRVRVSLVFAGSVVLAALIYGQVQLRRDTITQGPKIAILQGDFVSRVQGDSVNSSAKRRIYHSMLRAAAKDKPDLYLLPETPWIMYLNPEARDFHSFWRKSFAALQKHATRNNAYLVTGSASLVETPHDLMARERRYNSATVFRPDGSEPGRYDKVHLVYFGELVPFRFGRLRFLYLWLNRLMPFSGSDGKQEYSLFPGDGFHRFTMESASQEGRAFRFGIPICYEDVMPYVSRKFVAGGSTQKRVDFLLNISNDGWFGRGHQQPQHLAICVFRAVENRVGIARAVNTGVSAFIQPSGRIHDVVTGDSSNDWPGECGFAVANVGVDSRFSLYSQYGDWFAWLCALAWLIFFVDYWVARVRAAAQDGVAQR